MKRIFLTGASSGIGLAIAEALIARGDEVWGTSREAKRVPALDGLHSVTLDLLNSDTAKESFLAAWEDAGGFDVVINNAGGGHFTPADQLARVDLVEQFQTLFFAQVQLMQVAIEQMRPRGSGMIINVSSLATRLPVPYMAAYNAAKSALASFTMTLQIEARRSAIRIVDVQPADIRTRFNDAIKTTTPTSPGEKERFAHVWAVVDTNMQTAPPPELVAGRIAKLINEVDPPPRVTVGSTFQAAVAPAVFRFLPQRVCIWGLKKYYGL